MPRRRKRINWSWWAGLVAHVALFAVMFWPNSPKAAQIGVIAAYVLNAHKGRIRNAVNKRRQGKEMTRLLPILACLLLTACAHISPTAVSSAAGRATGHLEAAQQDVAQAIPHADPIGQSLLHSATGDLSVVAQQMPTFEKAANDLAKANADLAAEKAHWVGYKARVALRWIIGIGVGVTVLLGVLQAFSAVPFVAITSQILTAIATAGLSVVHAISAWATRRVFGISTAIIQYQSKPGETPAVAK